MKILWNLYNDVARRFSFDVTCTIFIQSFKLFSPTIRMRISAFSTDLWQNFQVNRSYFVNLSVRT